MRDASPVLEIGFGPPTTHFGSIWPPKNVGHLKQREFVWKKIYLIFSGTVPLTRKSTHRCAIIPCMTCITCKNCIICNDGIYWKAEKLLFLTGWLTDNLKSRDANASKKLVACSGMQIHHIWTAYFWPNIQSYQKLTKVYYWNWSFGIDRKGCTP